VCYSKNMRKRICTGGIIFGLLVFNVAFAQSSASTEQDLLAIIKQLQAQIQSLQAQVTDLQTQVQSVKLELKFSRALAQGATGDDVKQLQEFLKTFTGAYPDGLITGYFGPLTEAAVKRFQEQNGIESVGVVGPITQNKLNVLATAIPATPAIPSPETGIQAISAAPAIPTTPGGPAVSAMPATPCKTPSGVQIPFSPTVITVLSPNGGEQWQVGGTYTIKYSAKDIVGNKALLVYLNKGYDAPTTKTGVNSSQLIGVTTNLESYTYTVPNSIQSWPGLGSNYTISIYVEGSYSSCDAISYIGDSSDAEFSIVAGQDNAPVATPTVSAPSPVTTTSGGGYGAIAAPMPIPTPTLAQTILTTQDKIANIQAQISALQNQLNTTTDDGTRASLRAQIAALQTVIQELQNQIFQGQPLPVSAPTSAPITPSIPTTTPQATPTTQDQIAALSKQISTLQNQLNITTDDATRTSLMTQIVALNVQMKALQSTLTIPISSGSTTTAAPIVQGAPSVAVLSPNGGETLTIGKMYEIKWTGGNNAVDVYLLDSPTRLGKKIFSGITNNNYVSWVAAPLSSSDLWNGTTGVYAAPSGQYVMWVGCADNNCTVDDSDSYFKIVAQ
jgi:peptidoglycan hydrolase CwlO-like protein